MTLKIKANGGVTEVSAKTLQEKQNHVGGYIEPIYLKEGSVMYVNEEGLLHNLPSNPLASIIAGKPIVGDVIITKIEEDEVH